MDYWGIVRETLVLMAYILIGYGARRFKLLSDTGIGEISRLVVNVALPLLVFKAFLIDYAPEHVTNMLLVAGGSLLFMILAILAGNLLYPPKKSPDAGTKIYCVAFGNAAFLGFPICSALFGDIGVFYASIFLAVQDAFVYTYGINVFQHRKIALKDLKSLLNPGLIAIVAGLVAFFIQLDVPKLPMSIIQGAGGITVPLALMVIGARLYGTRITEILADRPAVSVSLVKTLLVPAVFAAVLFLLPIPPLLKAVLIVEAAAPVQASSSAMARTYGGNSMLAAKAVFLSTIICLVTIPLFLWVIR